jgi:hypothetical protein
MESLKIVLLCLAAAVGYGICHDQITARICVEYFTVGHPPIFGGTQDPNLLAFGWGVFATWWVGAMLGVPAALLARVGSRPKLGWRHFRIPLGVLTVLVALAAVVGGLVGYAVTGPLNAYYVPELGVQSSVPFAVAAEAHGAAYSVGFVGGVLVWGWIWWRRGRDRRRQLATERARLRREKDELTKRRPG